MYSITFSMPPNAVGETENSNVPPKRPTSSEMLSGTSAFVSEEPYCAAVCIVVKFKTGTSTLKASASSFERAANDILMLPLRSAGFKNASIPSKKTVPRSDGFNVISFSAVAVSFKAPSALNATLTSRFSFERFITETAGEKTSVVLRRFGNKALTSKGRFTSNLASPAPIKSSLLTTMTSTRHPVRLSGKENSAVPYPFSSNINDGFQYPTYLNKSLTAKSVPPSPPWFAPFFSMLRRPTKREISEYVLTSRFPTV